MCSRTIAVQGDGVRPSKESGGSRLGNGLRYYVQVADDDRPQMIIAARPWSVFDQLEFQSEGSLVRMPVAIYRPTGVSKWAMSEQWFEFVSEKVPSRR
jgi:hypothetical protein